jgi:zinc transport system substrate-binding protein
MYGLSRWALAVAVCLLVCTMPGSSASAQIKVVVTIKPIHSLVAAVMAGAGEPRLLIDGAASPHTFALKPSDARALNEADVVFRVSAGLETFLSRILHSLPKSVRVITLDEVPRLVMHSLREGGAFDGQAASAEHHHAGHSHAVAPGGGKARDVHLWLDPDNAKLMTHHIAEVLATEMPERAALFRANAAAAAARLDALSSELEHAVRPLRQLRYVVFHDAYQYFERRYGLSPAGSVTISPELAASAKRLTGLRNRMKALNVACVLAEPQFEPKLIQTVIEGTKARSGTLDPLGADVQPGADLYFTVMRGLAAGLSSCLAASR